MQKYRNVTATNWISKLFGDKFHIANGVVKLGRKPAAPPPEPPPPPPDQGAKQGLNSLDFFARMQAARQKPGTVRLAPLRRSPK
jgi:hypothetical protein